MTDETPLSSRMRRFGSSDGGHLFVVQGSRIYDIDPETSAAVDRALRFNDQDALPPAVAEILGPSGHSVPRPLLSAPPITALSLNLAQACNMGCGYCYAEQGSFGGVKRSMSADVARASIDRLLRDAPAGARVAIAYMGGEPLLTRKLLHDTTRYAYDAAQKSGHQIGFSLTTNATLISEDDALLFSDYRFSITVSIDGPPEVQNRERPMLSGAASSARVEQGIERLLARPPRELTARMTVGAQTTDLPSILEFVLSLGFNSAGFAPVIASPRRDSEVQGEALVRFTEQMILCGRHALGEMMAGRSYGFSNLETALNELHRGSVRAHPCGAGAGYLSVDAGGEAYACHRLVGDEHFRYGNFAQGVDHGARLAHLTERAVDNAEPCRSCWARYLCGGGCYHEVDRRGRQTCDHIRSWLTFCLEAYVTLSSARPEDFVWAPRACAPSMQSSAS